MQDPHPDATLRTLRALLAAFNAHDLDAIMAFFADDAVYHNIPVDPVTGIEAIRSTIEGFTAASSRSSSGSTTSPARAPSS